MPVLVLESGETSRVEEETQGENWPWDPLLSRELWQEARRETEQPPERNRAQVMSPDKRMGFRPSGRHSSEERSREENLKKNDSFD